MEETKTVLAPSPVILDIPVPDFEIKCCIGEGAFGQVFLGLSRATGRYRAIKVVRRSSFQSEHPYEVEFAGLKRFEEVSREHEGFVDVLHVHRDDVAGYFWYVMELADDLETGQQIEPARYVPRTLSKELAGRGRLPASECVRVGLALSAALAELHRRELVHRDVKTRNVIFVRGAPKLADVGLVTEPQWKPETLIGTPGYMDPEVHGTPAGDLYGFGKVLYAMGTGCKPADWPQLPQGYEQSPELAVLRELEAIWRNACQENRDRRYSSAAEIHKELLALQGGASVLRLKRFERVLGFVRRYGLVLLLLLACLGGVIYLRARQQAQASELRQRKVGSFVANGNHAFDSADFLGALSWFAEAWLLDEGSGNDFIHRVRIGSVLQRTPTLVQMWFQPRQVKEAFFPGQENQVVMADFTGHWQVYDLGSGQPLHKPFGMGLPNERISLSGRTGLAVTAAATNRIWLWDYQSGAIVRELQRPQAVFTYTAISTDAQWIAATDSSGKTNESLLLWKAQASEPPVELGRFPKEVHSVAFSPDSRLLLCAGSDGRARVWDLQTLQLLSTFTNHQSWVYSGSFSPDSRYAVTASFDRSARIWQPRTGREVARFNHDDAIFAAEFSSDGTRLVTAGLDFSVRIWNVATQVPLQVLRHNSKVLRAAFSPQDRFLLTSCYDDTVRVWRLPENRPATLSSGFPMFGGLRTILPTNGLWTVCDRAARTVGPMQLTNEAGVRFWFAPDDRFFAASYLPQTGVTPNVHLKLFDSVLATAAPRSLVLPPGWSNLTLSPGGRWVLASDSRSGGVWDAGSGKRARTVAHACQHASFSPDASLLALSWGNQVEVLDIEQNFARLAAWSHPTNAEVSAIEWDPAGRRLLTSCWNGTFTPLAAQAWDARTGAPAGPRLQHRDGVLYGTFSHNGSCAITCGEDFTASLWNPATGRELAPPLQHRDQVFYAAFSEDDRLVATAARDNTITVWAVDTGEPLSSLALTLAPGSSTPVVRFMPGNRTVMIRDGFGRSFLWELPYYSRPLRDLLLISQLLSAQQTDSTETLMPQSKEALQQIWQQLKAKYPADFSLPPQPQ